MERVSIIIPFYNCRYVDAAIKSALKQSYKNIEVIVVDDGSTQYAHKVAPFKNEITYIRKANGGTASALNLGVKHATGSYFAWLSSDDMFVGNKIERQLHFMQSINAHASYTAFKTIDEDNNIINEIRSRKLNRKTFQKILLEGCPINGCTVMAKIELIKRAGWFDEKLKYTQDYEMWCRLSQYTNIHYLDEILTLYRVHKKMGSYTHGKSIHSESAAIKNKYKKIFEKNDRK
ncbi:glycosyltransferase [Rossellomorea aquimaris]|uniref:Glycosyltransferase 2-like domain-containing protein n=1 Tax=Rossellomorea aquimaris TaxID=189382 RepID=A0A1J6WWD0_9BACI|nr:glycosyltransferase [Rossellomorea aquimaris]OIU72143.1 hypothetical protein BHE18_05790 [Rossellomorea aquimaris]